ncbi:MAG: hypothetical protein Q8Q03_00930 [bacterium]|nr:hypothetical protein [bacterium]
MKQESHKGLLILILILAVIVGVIIFFSDKNTKKSDSVDLSPEATSTVPSFIPASATTEEKKEKILEYSAKAGEKPLTEQEKTDIAKELAPGNAQKYDLSDEEKDAIINALNNE